MGCCPMAKELDTSWFDLKNYEAFKTMSIEGWIYQFIVRDHYHRLERNRLVGSDEHDRELSWVVSTLKPGVIEDSPNYPHDMHNRRAEGVLDGPPFSTASVNSLTSYDLWRMTKNDDLSHVWEACEHALDSSFEVDQDPFEADQDSFEVEHNSDLFEIADAPHDFYIKQYSHFDIEPYAHVVINLSATDEQIKNDFSHWLTHYRQAISYQNQKRLFTQVDFDYWVEYGVIPYLDLALIAKIEGKKITQNKLARMIFPNEYDVDIVERVRKVTKPTAEWLIKSEIYAALSTQLAYEKVTGMKNA